MSATPTPAVRTVGHPVRYPLLVGEVYRATCRCHWWQPVRDSRDPGRGAA